MTDKIENFEPLQPLDIKFKKPEKLHVCGCNPENPIVKEVEEALAVGCGCGSKLYTAIAPLMVFEESCAMPVSVEKLIVKENEIKSAQDVINEVFSLFRPAGTEPDCSKIEKIIKELELDTPKVDLKAAPEIQDAVIAKIAEKILAKMEGRVAIIKQKDSKLSCLGKDDKIEYLVVEGGKKSDSEVKPGGDAKPENPANPETPKPVDPANPANPAKPGTEDLPADARDGIIEDLVGVIEVMPTATTATSAQ
jgi:hypothetical protein|nr:MAG TPA: hypothetical protein [Myoviridae sp. ctTS62]